MGERSSHRNPMDIDLNPENPEQLSHAIGAMNLNDSSHQPFHIVSNLLDIHTWENVSNELDRFLFISRNRSVERAAEVPQPQPSRISLSGVGYAEIPQPQPNRISLSGVGYAEVPQPQPSRISLSGVGYAEVPQASESSNVGVALDSSKTESEKKENAEKGYGSDGGFYDCNICLGLAKDPVVTCCGHLFCWPCLYRWLHLRSANTKECPVCKGEVKDKNVIPIYGGGNDVEVRGEDSSSNLQIPHRPNARRKDSNTRQSRQTRVRNLGREFMVLQ